MCHTYHRLGTVYNSAAPSIGAANNRSVNSGECRGCIALAPRLGYPCSVALMTKMPEPYPAANLEGNTAAASMQKKKRKKRGKKRGADTSAVSLQQRYAYLLVD